MLTSHVNRFIDCVSTGVAVARASLNQLCALTAITAPYGITQIRRGARPQRQKWAGADGTNGNTAFLDLYAYAHARSVLGLSFLCALILQKWCYGVNGVSLLEVKQANGMGVMRCKWCYVFRLHVSTVETCGEFAKTESGGRA